MLPKKRLLAAVLLVLGLLTGCAEQQEGTGGQDRSSAPPVEVAEVRTATFERTASGIGTLQASETVRIRPEISRRIKEIRFKEGSAVEKGSVLFTLEQEKLRRRLKVSQAQLALARARMDFAKTSYERYQALSEDGVSPQERLDEVESEYEQSQAEVERWKAQVELNKEQLSDTRIVAPFDGFIGDRQVDEGQLVDPGTVLATLYRTSTLEARISLPERYTDQVKEGQTVRVQMDAYPDRTFSGPITYVGPSVQQSTRTFAVKAKLDNEKNLLRPGIFITAEVVLESREQRPWIPEEALVATRTGYQVFVVEDGQVEARSVEVGLRQVGRAEIAQGLEAGERVVRTGHMELTDGDRVMVQDSADTSGSQDI